MQKRVTTLSKSTASVSTKNVKIFIDPTLVILVGNWKWDMHCDSVFCSNVILSLPHNFEGTVGIIHPDDLRELEQRIAVSRQLPIDFSFRIITTYGEIKTLTGENISCEEGTELPAINVEKELTQTAEEQANTYRENELYNVRQKVNDFAETITETGTWYINSATNEVFYSDQVFRIHGVLPQSFNAHFHTFSSFITPAQGDAVTAAIEKSYNEHLPLHMEYDILRPDHEERHLQYASRWIYNQKGEEVLCGILVDITNAKTIEQQKEAATARHLLQTEIIRLHEQFGNLGHWSINLKTRKTFFSANFYKIYGEKPSSALANFKFFRERVHPEDRQIETDALALMLSSHQPPDVEFRIIRADSKVRYIVQKGRILTYGGQLTMVVSVKDVTEEKRLEQNINKGNHELQLREIAWAVTEEVNGNAYWIYNVETDQYIFSENIYRIFGVKIFKADFNLKNLIDSLHPADKKKVTDVFNIFNELQTESKINFRILVKGEIKHIRSSIRQLDHHGKKYSLATFQDVSEEALQIAEFKERIQTSEAVSENISDRIIITDLNHDIIFWNKACEKVYNLNRQDVTGKNLFEVFPQLNTESNYELYNGVLQGKTAVIKDLASAILNERINLQLIALKDAENKVTGILHVVQDVTKEHELQKSLSLRLSFIERVVEASVDRIIALDNHLNIVTWNKSSEVHFRKKKQDVLGKNILEVFPELINDALYYNFRKASKGELIHIPAIDAAVNKNYYETYLIPVKDEKEAVQAVLWIVHDLTKEFEMQHEQLKAAKLLQEEHRRLKEAQTIGNVGSFELDVATGMVYWSDETYRIHGIEPQSEAITFDRVLSFIDEEYAPGSIEKIKECTTKEGKADFVQRIIRRDGEQRIVRRQIQSYADENGSITHISGSIQDITELVLAQQKIAESEELLRSTEEAAQTGSYELTLATNVMRFTDGVFRIYGEEPQSFQPSMEFIEKRSHPDDVPVVKQVLDNAISNKQPYYYTRRIYTKTGEERFVEVQGKIACDHAGNAVKLLGLVHDITERRKKDETIQQMLNGSIAAITILQSIRNRDGKIIDFVIKGANKAAEAINKKPLEELVEHRLLTLFPGMKDGLFDKYVEVVETGTSIRLQQYYKHEHFNHWFDISAVKNFDGIILTFHDITEQKKAEQELRETKDFIEEIAVTTPDLITIHDAVTNTIIYANHGNLWKHEFDEQDVYRAPDDVRVDLLIHPDDKEKATQFIRNRRLLADGETLEIELRNRSPRNHWGWLRIRSKVFKRDAEGKAAQVISFTTNITAQKEAELRSEQSSHLLQLTTQASPDAITIFDLEKNQPLYLNGVLGKWLGYTNDELIGIGFEGRLEFIHKDDREAVLAHNRGMLQATNEEVRSIEYRVITKEGKTMWLCNRTKVFRRDAAGKVIQILSVLQDITDRKS